MADHEFRGPLLLLAGTANRPLAEEVADELGIPLGDMTIKRFADGEIFVRINQNARGRDVFIIQPMPPPADSIMELLLMVDVAKRASAARVTVVVPYYGYARQDRKDQPRVAISAKLVANLIEAAGAERVLGMDFHTHQIQGFFDIPVDHLYAAPVLTRYFKEKGLDNPVVVAPDVGAAKMARGFARRLNASFAIIDKRRPAPNQAEVLTVVGEVEGRICVIVDDMIDTAGTLGGVIHALRERDASEVYAAASHAILSGPAVERLRDAPVTEVVVTNTLYVPDEKRFPKLTILSIAPLLAQAVRYTHSNESVSQLFD
ncbi:MAG: ribose-phosphate pyrophosphokinase [Gemmatimonadetes bacterium]|nr:ribose-phosphate pyrophosphokinase [Gemmatimonadota bacterium]